ncbi:unnamed protein product [Rotaria magnacalcarata]|uniref:Uncharacterized protein n=4 Tax=Rotaria magnacalcarata TaxID=392030 RepID=A0A816H952_9BILA|nr:unnamed protein product [Rotaria magnacalcarata]CAF4150781.1 unnamed protein product [Rotaria magnacalcarata]
MDERNLDSFKKLLFENALGNIESSPHTDKKKRRWRAKKKDQHHRTQNASHQYSSAITSQSMIDQTKERCLYGKCSFFGDPHLIPFASSYGGPQAQYWCQEPGWQLLIGNSYVSIYILVGASPYWIIDYVLIFPGVSPCVIIGSSTSPPLCASTTLVTSVTLSVGSSWSHFHNTKCIIVQIEKRSSFYNIHVYESYSLINLSVGLCRKWNCTKESRWMTPLAVIPKLCNIFINAAKQRAMGDIKQNIIDMATTSCINDMQMTFDPAVAVTGLSLVLDGSAESQLDGGDTKTLFKKAAVLKHDAILNATQVANVLIYNTKELCNEQKQCLRPINNIRN